VSVHTSSQKQFFSNNQCWVDVALCTDSSTHPHLWPIFTSAVSSIPVVSLQYILAIIITSELSVAVARMMLYSHRHVNSHISTYASVAWMLQSLAYYVTLTTSPHCAAVLIRLQSSSKEFQLYLSQWIFIIMNVCSLNRLSTCRYLPILCRHSVIFCFISCIK